jgi:hypothetical protein
MFSNFFLPENRIVYEVMSKDLVELERPQEIWRMRVSCLLSKAIRAKAHPRACAPPPPPHTHTRTEICNTFCFFSAPMVSRTHLSYVVCTVLVSYCFLSYKFRTSALWWLVKPKHVALTLQTMRIIMRIVVVIVIYLIFSSSSQRGMPS